MLGAAMDKTMASLCTGNTVILASFQQNHSGKRFQSGEEASLPWEGIPGVPWVTFLKLRLCWRDLVTILVNGKQVRFPPTYLKRRFTRLFAQILDFWQPHSIQHDSFTVRTANNCNSEIIRIIWAKKNWQWWRVVIITGEPPHPQCQPTQRLRQLGRQRRWALTLGSSST